MVYKLRFEGLKREEAKGISNTRGRKDKSPGRGKRDVQGTERPVCWHQGSTRGRVIQREDILLMTVNVTVHPDT